VPPSSAVMPSRTPWANEPATGIDTVLPVSSQVRDALQQDWPPVVDCKFPPKSPSLS
jgi:hypothetical protein